ncbi:MAG: hypothetical protein ACFE8E_03945 [Candidatus Hodarchaeota archaeon]
MVKRGGRRVIHFYNPSGNLDNTIKFLESIQKKVNYLNLNCEVEGKSIKVTLYGPKELQYLAIERLRELANQFLS